MLKHEHLVSFLQKSERFCFTFAQKISRPERFQRSEEHLSVRKLIVDSVCARHVIDNVGQPGSF